MITVMQQRDRLAPGERSAGLLADLRADIEQWHSDSGQGQLPSRVHCEATFDDFHCSLAGHRGHLSCADAYAPAPCSSRSPMLAS